LKEEEHEEKRKGRKSSIISGITTTTREDFNDPNFERKLDIITAGAQPFVREHLLHRISNENCSTIINYMLAMQTEVSPSQTYRDNIIIKLKQFSESHNSKSFSDITRQDIIDFLDSFRKPESVDPLHQ